MVAQGELTKVRILAFTDKTYRKRLKGDKGQIELPINPENISRKIKINYKDRKPSGAQGGDPDYESTDSESLELKFTFDGTGVIPVQGKANQFHKDVAKQVRNFLKVAYRMNSETHRPNFLRILWGSFSFGEGNSFDCVMTDLDIQYTLLSPTGKPLRAELKATFISYVEENRRLREEGKKSPDVTHVRTIGKEDTLPLMTEQIYGDQSYYLQVAKTNGLVNFRRLNSGKSLRFPPIDKTIL